MSQHVVKIRELSRQFGSRMALYRINPTILEGAVYGLVGGNGAGKTTLIKHILGLPTSPEGFPHGTSAFSSCM